MSVLENNVVHYKNVEKLHIFHSATYTIHKFILQFMYWKLECFDI